MSQPDGQNYQGGLDPYSGANANVTGPHSMPGGFPQNAPGVPEPGYPAAPPVARPTNQMAIVSLVLSVTGIFFCGLTAIVGAILGHVARGQLKRDPSRDGMGLALAGVIIGWVIVAGWVIYWGVIIGAVVVGVMNAP